MCDVRETEYFITRLSWVIIMSFLLLPWSCKLKASVHHFVYISTVQLLSDWFLRSVFLLLPITCSWFMFFMVFFSPMLGEYLRFFGVPVLRVYGFPVGNLERLSITGKTDWEWGLERLGCWFICFFSLMDINQFVIAYAMELQCGLPCILVSNWDDCHIPRVEPWTDLR